MKDSPILVPVGWLQFMLGGGNVPFSIENKWNRSLVQENVMHSWSRHILHIIQPSNHLPAKMITDHHVRGVWAPRQAQSCVTIQRKHKALPLIYSIFSHHHSYPHSYQQIMSGAVNMMFNCSTWKEITEKSECQAQSFTILYLSRITAPYLLQNLLTQPLTILGLL